MPPVRLSDTLSTSPRISSTDAYLVKRVRVRVRARVRG
tara:strand:+ start:400 stop:513 length:114 start_codon:yes stop_codon:yes gene_type:complete